MEENKKNEKIALFGGSFKPYHFGHHQVVTFSSFYDKFLLFVSSKDRIREGEFPIYWKRMKKVWEDYIIPYCILDPNVEVIYTENPATSMWKYLQSWQLDPNFAHKKFYIYEGKKDPEDPRKNCIFTEQKIKKYLPCLYLANKIKKFETTRFYTGKNLRNCLQNHDLNAFNLGLPKEIQHYAIDIYHILCDGNNTNYKQAIETKERNNLHGRIIW